MKCTVIARHRYERRGSSRAADLRWRDAANDSERSDSDDTDHTHVPDRHSVYNREYSACGLSSRNRPFTCEPGNLTLEVQLVRAGGVSIRAKKRIQGTATNPQQPPE